MNEEIKEILDKIKEIYDIHEQIIIKHNNSDEITFFLSIKEGKLLLDFITNLQQENKRLKQPKIFIDTQDMEERYGEELYKEYLEEQVKDYKSRIDKATELIKQIFKDENWYKNYEYNDLEYALKEVAIILYGGSVK